MKCTVAERAYHFDQQFVVRGFIKDMDFDEFALSTETSFNDPTYKQESIGPGKTGPRFEVPVNSPRLSRPAVVILEMFRQCHLRLITVWSK